MLTRADERYDLLCALTDLTTTELDRTRLFQHVLAILNRSLGYDYATIQIIHHEARRELMVTDGSAPVPPILYPLSEDDWLKQLFEGKRPVALQRTDAAQPWPVQPALPDSLSWLGLPLLFRGKPVGLITLESRQSAAYQAIDTELLRLVGQQLALNIRNDALYQARADRMRESEIINQTLQKISGKLDIAALSETILDAVSEITGSTRCAIFYPSADQPDVLEIRHATSMTAHEKSKKFPIGEGIAGLVYQQGEPIYVSDSTKDARFKRFADVTEYPRSLLVAPIIADNQTIGVISAESAEPNYFDPADIEPLRTLGVQIGVAVQRQRMLDALAAQKQGQTAYLAEISQTILQLEDTDEEEILRRILHITQAMFRRPLLSEIRLIEGLERDLVIKCRVPDGLSFVKDHKRLAWGKGITGVAADRGEVVVVPDVWADPNYLFYVHGTKSEMVIPFKNDAGEVIGIINIEHGERFAFADEDKPLGEAVAVLAQVAMNKARQLRVMQNLRELQAALAEGDNLQALFRLVLEKALMLTDTRYGSIHLKEDDDRTLTLVHYVGFPDENVLDFKTYIGESRGVTALAATRGQAIVIDNVRAPEWRDIFADVSNGAVESALAVPMRIAPFGVVGVINLEDVHPGKFTEQHKRLIEQLAEVAAIAYKNTRMTEYAVLSQAVGWMGLQGAEFDHELSQNVRAIQGALNGLDGVIRKRITDVQTAAALREGLRGIHDALDDMRRFTDASDLPSLPDIDREDGPCEPQRQTVVDAVVKEMVEAEMKKHSRLFIVPQLGCGDARACIDERWFRAAMGKLLHNACKVTPDKKSVRVRTRFEGGRVLIHISDEGSGIPPAIRPYFLKASVPRRAGSPGSGMGALLAKFIAQRYGGNVRLVESSEARGTTLCLELPLSDAK